MRRMPGAVRKVNPSARAEPAGGRRARALRFVVLVGVMSFFADFTYEGARGIVGPYFAALGASAVAVAVVTGLGELLGYAFRLVSGGLSDRTGRFWPITIVGYVVQMTAVPLLAVAPSWQVAAVLVLLERLGRATRNPPRDVMLSHAAKEMGYGWAFGVHEALDQCGALFGPLVMAAVLASRRGYREAFALLAIPAAIMLGVLLLARLAYPRPEELGEPTAGAATLKLPAVFWTYLTGAVLVAAGFADFPFMAYHWERQAVVPSTFVPAFYAVAMAVSGAGSLLFGRLFDRAGLAVLVPLTLVSAMYAPLGFLGGFWAAVVSSALWGLGMGVHEAIIPAAVALMVPVERRASAYGLFTACYGIFWFLGSLAIGLLYEASPRATVGFCLLAECSAVPVFAIVTRMRRHDVARPRRVV